MELNNEFEVAMPVPEAWAVLTDIEKIAPCMPGAELREVEGDEYRGVVKVKVGPITASYRGVARFQERNATTHKAVLKADGRETRGQGDATALITATLAASPKGTTVHVATDLALTGKVAQFGRGVLADVSGKLLDQFVHNLESTLLAAPGAGEPTTTDEPGAAFIETVLVEGNGSASARPVEQQERPAAPQPSRAPTGIRQITSSPAEPVDLIDIARGSLMRRFAPYLSVAGIVFIAWIVVFSVRRRRQ